MTLFSHWFCKDCLSWWLTVGEQRVPSPVLSHSSFSTRRVSRRKNKKKVYLCKKEKKEMFTKSRLNRSKHCTRHHFLKMNRCRWCWQTSSRLPWDLIMRWSRSRGCHHFLSFIFSVNARFVFGFVVFCLWVNSDIRWQTTHTGSFLIPCLGSCPVSTDLKLSLSSLARYAIFGQFDRRPNCLFQIWVRFDFKY